jgi:hypothetical protein
MRLQVLLPDEEMEDIRRLAALAEVPVGEWVRRVLREARADRSKVDPREKLAALREAVGYSFPTGDIGQMNAEIEKGYAD